MLVFLLIMRLNRVTRSLVPHPNGLPAGSPDCRVCRSDLPIRGLERMARHPLRQVSANGS